MLPLVPLLGYLFVMAVTPAPNNIMLAVSGVNFGFRRTPPHIFGICFGNMIQVLLCASLLLAAGEWIDGDRAGRPSLAAFICYGWPRRSRGRPLPAVMW